jgi:integrase
MGFEGRYRPPDRSKYLLQDEIKALLKASSEVGAFAQQFLRFSANTGVRPSESNEVRVKDLFASENRVRIRTLKQKKKEGEEKARDVFRDVDLAPEFCRDLSKALKNRTPMEKLFPRSRVTLWSIFKKAAKLAGLSQSYTLYSLRHSRCIYLLEWTGDLLYTSQQMGHSSLDVTKVYFHCLPSKRENYVKTKLESF